MIEFLRFLFWGFWVRTWNFICTCRRDTDEVLPWNRNTIAVRITDPILQLHRIPDDWEIPTDPFNPEDWSGLLGVQFGRPWVYDND